MSNMPILPNNTPASGKAATQAAQGNNVNESATADVLPFGDVLARQISDNTDLEIKTIEPLMIETPLLPTADMVKTEDVVDTTNTALPADILATLLPVAVAVAQMDATAQKATVDSLTPQIDTAILNVTVGKAPSTLPTTTLKDPAPAIEMVATTTPKPSFKEEFPALALNANVMAFATEVEISDKSDFLATAPSIQVTAPLPNPMLSMPNVYPIMAPVTRLVVDAPITQQQWSNEFSQKITWMATQQDQHAELHLNPAQLGPVDVVIKVSGDQATAQFTSAHAAVREVIEQSIPKLREMLADNGIMLGNTTVSDQASREQRGEFGSQPQTAPNGRVLESVPSNMSDTRVVIPSSRHNGMVDTFA
jgi:flagellar hook-length control protein FliK